MAPAQKLGENHIAITSALAQVPVQREGRHPDRILVSVPDLVAVPALDLEPVVGSGSCEDMSASLILC